ncbi:hypothetical protein [Spirillospora sp. CA-294931]|uniref:hypothetical protein n=1 Tax=Spirillospora sp. CA-294931 TaxID=3240042 RepID=UPI003D8CFD37
MNTATKIGAYVLGLAALFGGAAGIGNAVGPVGATEKQGEGETHGGHGGSKTATTAKSAIDTPGGLMVTRDGYTLRPKAATIVPGEPTDFQFTVNGPDGRPVTDYQPLHGKKLHLIVARRDLSGFQHVHPTMDGSGVWSIPLTLKDPGVYRFLTDIKPAGEKEQLTLGVDITAPGDYQPTKLPLPTQVAVVDGYAVSLTGKLTPGRSSKVTLTVSKDGEPITDLEPYLEAYGHLVALRDGDLAYLHVHPEGEPGDGKTKPGPGVTFFAEVPSAGTYRLYLDFQHKGKVRTAEFTVAAGGADPVPPTDEGGDGHGHDH